MGRDDEYPKLEGAIIARASARIEVEADSS
jgi:hypothetical protein